MLSMNSIYKALLLPVMFGLAAPLARASMTRSLVDTVWNAKLPSQTVAIKNVDVIRYEYASGPVHRVRYALEVYVWFNAVVEQSPAPWELKVVEASGARGIGAPSSPVRVGLDSATGYSVYKAEIEVPAQFKAALYAQVISEGGSQYSNEGHPNDFFEVHGSY